MNHRLTLIWIRATSRAASQRGATTTEYALVTILIAIVAMTALVLVGEETSAMYTTISDEVAAASS